MLITGFKQVQVGVIVAGNILNPLAWMERDLEKDEDGSLFTTYTKINPFTGQVVGVSADVLPIFRMS